ncbi:MAG: hypothetical protein ACOC5S_01525 [Acidobacteriota bacterium]
MAGLNTNVKRKQADYHVQTEDKGHGINQVETIIYKSGKVLVSRKSSYTSLLNHPKLKQKIQQIIEKQHEDCLKEINEGKFDHL